MNDERYTKHYVNILNSTLTETILRNVQMQANAQFVDELVGELNQENENLRKQIQEMGEQLQDKLLEISVLHDEKNEIDEVRHQLTHLETFRNELVKEREEHEKTRSKVEQLEKKIANLQSPTKRKKPVVSKAELPVEDDSVKDGGTF
jgi:chromosome segregation ATPase